MEKKEKIMLALRAFAGQRPGLEFGNYGEVKAYRSEMRAITRDLHHARELIRAVELRQSIGAEEILEAGKSGRLEVIELSGKIKVDYCTGQYFPTEYRKAVVRLMVTLLFAYTRECMPKPVLMHNSETGELVSRYDGMRAGDWIRSRLSREFGRWINRYM